MVTRFIELCAAAVALRAGLHLIGMNNTFRLKRRIPFLIYPLFNRLR